MTVLLTYAPTLWSSEDFCGSAEHISTMRSLFSGSCAGWRGMRGWRCWGEVERRGEEGWEREEGREEKARGM